MPGCIWASEKEEDVDGGNQGLLVMCESSSDNSPHSPPFSVKRMSQSVGLSMFNWGVWVR